MSLIHKRENGISIENSYKAYNNVFQYYQRDYWAIGIIEGCITEKGRL